LEITFHLLSLRCLCKTSSLQDVSLNRSQQCRRTSPGAVEVSASSQGCEVSSRSPLGTSTIAHTVARCWISTTQQPTHRPRSVQRCRNPTLHKITLSISVFQAKCLMWLLVFTARPSKAQLYWPWSSMTLTSQQPEVMPS